VSPHWVAQAKCAFAFGSQETARGSNRRMDVSLRKFPIPAYSGQVWARLRRINKVRPGFVSVSR